MNTRVSARRPLSGRPLPGRPAAQRGGPHERVLALQRRAGNRAVAQLMREPAAPELTDLPRLRLPPSCRYSDAHITKAEETGRDRDVRRITLSDGSVFLVRRKRRVVVSERLEPIGPKFGTGSDSDRVWVKVEWCDGSRGEIRLGANPQGAAKDVINTISNTINSGGSAQDVLKAITDAQVTPFVSVDIAQSGNWQVTGEIDVSVNRQGFKGGKGTVEVHVGRVRLGGDVTVDEQGRPTGGGIHVGVDDAPPTYKCKKREKVYIQQFTEYEWTPWIPEKTETDTVTTTRPVPSDYYVYFGYANATVDAKRSESQRRALVAELARGGEVYDIKAFTSPEGTREKGPGFQGNDKLSDDRAAAALTWAQAALAEAGAGSVTATPHVIEPGEQHQNPELYSPPPDPKGKESAGRELEENVIEEFPEHEEEARHRTPELEKELAAAKGRHAKAELIYRLLRRAVISVRRTETETHPVTRKVPGHFADHPDWCPPVPDAEVHEHFPRELL